MKWSRHIDSHVLALFLMTLAACTARHVNEPRRADERIAALEEQLRTSEERVQTLERKLDAYGPSERVLRQLHALRRDFTESQRLVESYRALYGLLGDKTFVGRVEAATGTRVTISIGTLDGVRIGDNFRILRRTLEHIAYGKIVEITRDSAVVRVDEQREPAQVGDTAWFLQPGWRGR